MFGSKKYIAHHDKKLSLQIVNIFKSIAFPGINHY